MLIKGFRNYLVGELEVYRNAGIVKAANLKKAADVIVTLIEGLEYHAHFLSENEPFEEFASYSKQLVVTMLKGQTEADPMVVEGQKKNLVEDNIINWSVTDA